MNFQAMERASNAKKLSSPKYRILHYGAIILMVLAAFDLHSRFKSIAEKHSWLQEQRMKLSEFHEGDTVQRLRRDVASDNAQLLGAIRSRVNTFEFR